MKTSIALFILIISFAHAGTLEKVQAISAPKEWKEVKLAYTTLDEAVTELEKKEDEKLLIAILQGYAKVSKKEKSLGGLESLAPYYKKNSAKVEKLANKHLAKDEAQAVLFGLKEMSLNLGKGNDPSVKD